MIRQGHYNPSVGGMNISEEKSSDACDSAIADSGVSYYTLDETILILLSGKAAAKKLLEG